MKYFVSIENIEYHRWQIELLIQSFKLVGAENDLVIGMADCPPSPGIYKHNLLKHKNLFIHENIGRTYNYLKLNKLFSLSYAVQNKMLGDDFMVLHPDMILYGRMHEVPHGINILFHTNNEPIDPKLKVVKDDLSSRGFPWFSLGGVMAFHDVAPDFFKDVSDSAMWLVRENGPEWDVERAAWMMSIGSQYGKGKNLILLAMNMEMSMLHPRRQSIVVHYKHGIPPVFNKRHYKDMYGSIIMATKNDPLDAMIVENPTPATDYVRRVVQSYIQEYRK